MEWLRYKIIRLEIKQWSENINKVEIKAAKILLEV